MHESFEKLVYVLNDKIVAYLPGFLAGLAFIALGLLVSMLVKRFLISIAQVLRIERSFMGFRWGKELIKADLRHGLYQLIGNIGFVFTLLMFVYGATSFWRLPVISRLLEEGILFLPRFITALVIFVLGWLLSSWAAKSVHKALVREEIPRATLITRFIKAVLLLFFSALALAEINIAREIVIIGFATVFITLGVLTVLFVASAGKNFVQKILDKDEEK